jgi:hypothetical protein
VTLRLITASLLAACVVVPTAVAKPQLTRAAAPPPDAFERAVPNRDEWYSPDAFMRYYRNHSNGSVQNHPDGFAGVASTVPRTAAPRSAGDDATVPSSAVMVALVGLAILGIGLVVRRLRPAAGAVTR